MRGVLSDTFHTKTFISEIKARPCLWDSNCDNYLEREAVREAWESMVRTFIPDWEQLDGANFENRIRQMQKKWKGLRDYFVRNRETLEETEDDDDPRSRKRKAPLLRMLQFLKNTCKPSYGPKVRAKRPKVKARPVPAPAVVDFDSDFSISSPEMDPLKKVEPTPTSSHTSEFHETTRKPMCRQETYNQSDPNMNFLLNILPDMRTMNERQNFEFRFEVMNLLKKIKYSSENDHRGSPQHLLVKFET